MRILSSGASRNVDSALLKEFQVCGEAVHRPDAGART
ncbi:MAG: hypothetical protein JWM76_190 [Pseudonocardiales bacterium]|nr:hypothetical protein [Pseudonocardiales bacterium]